MTEKRAERIKKAVGVALIGLWSIYLVTAVLNYMLFGHSELFLFCPHCGVSFLLSTIGAICLGFGIYLLYE